MIRFIQRAPRGDFQDGARPSWSQRSPIKAIDPQSKSNLWIVLRAGIDEFRQRFGVKS